MALESGTYINSLTATNPAATDGLAQADDHLRLIKATIKATFPNLTGAMTATHTELNNVTTNVTNLQNANNIDIQTKSGTASVTMDADAMDTYVKHSGTGTLTIGAGNADGQKINITTTGTMTISWHTGSQGISLGNSTKIASGIWDDTAGYWFFSETVTA